MKKIAIFMAIGICLFSGNALPYKQADLDKAMALSEKNKNDGVEDCDLTKADLEDCDLIKANLTGANLFVANLTGTVLSGTNLFGAKGLTSEQKEYARSQGAINVPE